MRWGVPQVDRRGVEGCGGAGTAAGCALERQAGTERDAAGQGEREGQREHPWQQTSKELAAAEDQAGAAAGRYGSQDSGRRLAPQRQR
jgi:hypothetical protein